VFLAIAGKVTKINSRMRRIYLMSIDITSFLHTKHLSKQVQSGDSKIHILRDVNMEIKAGETVAIVGASGSGKTTLLSILAGLDLPTSGEVFFDKQPLHQLSEEARASIRAKAVGFIFQSFQLLPTMTALENVMLPMEIQYAPSKQARAEAAEWLKRVGLGARLHHYPKRLSGGEQQRVAIARAFVNQRKIIFSDEMTGNLDTQTGRLVTDILFSLNQEFQTTLVLVTHDEHLSSRCEKRFQLSEGILQLC
jgi:putative ABC transport system ATP-binding protein